MERITNEENHWDHDVEGDAVEGPVVCASREEVLQALNKNKTGKEPGLSIGSKYGGSSLQGKRIYQEL